MRVIRFGMAVALVLAGGSVSFGQQQDPNAQPQQRQQGQQQGRRQQSPEMLAEKQLEDAQRAVREGPGRGPGQGQLGGASEGADANADDYVNKDDLFSVSVPCKFTVKDTVWATEYDSKVPGHIYSCKDGASEYEMSVINYTDIAKIRAAQEHTEAASGNMYAQIDLFGSVDYACTRMRSEAAKVTYDAWHYMNLIPGHELQYTMPDGRRVYAGVYLHEYRLYIMKATVPPKGIPPLLYTQSFAAVRPDGTAIRYQTIYRHPW